MTNLRLSIYLLDKPAQVYMQELGITYKRSVPQSIADQWWFFDCENVPDPLPEHVSLLTATLDSLIGYGLSIEDVKCLKNELA